MFVIFVPLVRIKYIYCSQGRNFEGVFPRVQKLEYKKQQERGFSLSRDMLQEAHLPLFVCAVCLICNEN